MVHSRSNVPGLQIRGGRFIVYMRTHNIWAQRPSSAYKSPQMKKSDWYVFRSSNTTRLPKTKRERWTKLKRQEIEYPDYPMNKLIAVYHKFNQTKKFDFKGEVHRESGSAGVAGFLYPVSPQLALRPPGDGKAARPGALLTFATSIDFNAAGGSSLAL